MHPSIELFRGIAAWLVLTTHYAHFLIPERSFLNFFGPVSIFFSSSVALCLREPFIAVS